jgi:hypothetical protein
LKKTALRKKTEDFERLGATLTALWQIAKTIPMPGTRGRASADQSADAK